jgi:CBS domain-containing protein
MASAYQEPAASSRPSVVWTRGRGCAELAELLGLDGATRVDGDLVEVVKRVRAELLVTRRLSSFDLVPVAVPVDLDIERIEGVLAAIGGGPHSMLTVMVTQWIAESLGVPARLVSGYGGDRSEREAGRVLRAAARLAPDLEGFLIEANGPADLVGSIDETTLLVLGAPGGSWLQRQFFGPGARLLAHAPGGAVVVRDAPRRAFHVLREAEHYLSPHLGTGDALRLLAFPVLPVVDHGKLVGIVRRAALQMVGDGLEVGAIMEDPVAVSEDTPLSEISEVAEALGGAPVPVIDDEGRLVGLVGP